MPTTDRQTRASSVPPPTTHRRVAPAVAFAARDEFDSTPPHVRALQFAELARVSERHGFDFMPNHGPPEEERTVTRSVPRVASMEGTTSAGSMIAGFPVVGAPHAAPSEPRRLPDDAATRDADAMERVRRHFAHLQLSGTVLHPAYQPAPQIDEIRSLDGVPLSTRAIDEWPPLAQCIICSGPKGDSYTICAGCYTTRLRDVERDLLADRPDLEENAIRGLKPLTKPQYLQAIRRTPRLEPAKRARLNSAAESVRSRLRLAVAQAHRAALLQELRDAVEEEGLTDEERDRRWQRFRAAQDAGERWSARAWHRGVGALSLDGVWYGLLAAEDMAAEDRDTDDEYPVEWLDDDWIRAPDRVDYLDEMHPSLVARSNTAAGTAEHRAAAERNHLIDAVKAAERHAAYGDFDSIVYAEWLLDRLNEVGGMPPRVRARAAHEWDAEECDRWDRWVDYLLGGDPSAAPESLDPLDADWCMTWGYRATSPTVLIDQIGDEDDLWLSEPAQEEQPARVAVVLPKLDRGLPSGRLRWPRFIQDDIEAEFQPWGCWIEFAEEDGETVRVWTGEDVRRKRRRLSYPAIQPILQRRLEEWARRGVLNSKPKRPLPRRPKGSHAAWEREIRIERRRRRFEHMAHANAGVHPTHIEAARHQAI